MLRLLVVAPFYKPAHVYGGPTFSIPAMCEGLSKLGCEVTVYTTNANGLSDLSVPQTHACAIGGVSVWYHHRKLPKSYFYSSSLRRALMSVQKGRYSLIYVASNWGYPFLPASRAAVRSDTPLIISPRGSLKRNAWKGKYVKKLLYHCAVERVWINRARLLHYTTELEADDSSWLGLAPKTVIVPNPVDLREFESLPRRGLFKSRFGLKSNDRVVLYLGRVEPAKGLELALGAFKSARHRAGDLIFVIAGPDEDNYVVVLRDRAERLGIGDAVKFTGLLSRSDRLAALVDSDVFLFPSYSENFGMSPIEAMACALPVIVSDQVGVAKWIQDEQAGVVVPLDKERITSALWCLLEDQEKRIRFGQLGSRLVRRQFDSTRVAEQMLTVFSEVTSGC